MDGMLFDDLMADEPPMSETNLQSDPQQMQWHLLLEQPYCHSPVRPWCVRRTVCVRICRLVRVSLPPSSSNLCNLSLSLSLSLSRFTRTMELYSLVASNCILGPSNNDKLTDGCEIDLKTNKDHCGNCSFVCSNNNMATRTCANEICNGNCNLGFADWYAYVCGTPMVERGTESEFAISFHDLTCVGGCSNMDKLTDGCEINTDTDASNCGGCGMACSNSVATPSCSGGVCNGVCGAGFANWYAFVSEFTCSSEECADGEERWLAVTAPSAPTAATSTRKPMPTTVAAVRTRVATTILPLRHVDQANVMEHAMPVLPTGACDDNFQFHLQL